MNICIRVSEQTKSRLKELSKEMGISQGKLVEKLLSNFYKFRSEDKQSPYSVSLVSPTEALLRRLLNNKIYEENYLSKR